MKLIVGLGNLSLQGLKSCYHNTRHNVGSDIVCYIALHLGLKFMPCGEYAKLAQGEDYYLGLCGQNMNQVGYHVQFVISILKIQPKDLVIIHDDVELKYGKLKWQFGNSLHGHNGLRDIADKLRTKDFGRLRIGVNKEQPLSEYVLSQHTDFQLEQIHQITNLIINNMHNLTCLT